MENGLSLTDGRKCERKCKNKGKRTVTWEETKDGPSVPQWQGNA